MILVEEAGAGQMTDKKPVARAVTTVRIAGNEIEILLDSQEAATVLGVHPRTLQRMAQRGEIAGVQVGKLWRFRGSSLASWIDRHSSQDTYKTA